LKVLIFSNLVGIRAFKNYRHLSFLLATSGKPQ